jgi:NADH dehydrogenase FAD-containing subunit
MNNFQEIATFIWSIADAEQVRQQLIQVEQLANGPAAVTQ